MNDAPSPHGQVSLSHGQVSLSRAVEILAAAGDPVTISALSRYVARYRAELAPTRRWREVLVDADRLREHRAANPLLPFVRLRAAAAGVGRG